MPHQQVKKNIPVSGVSVVVCFRNEEKHLAKCVESILNQNYPKSSFELILVNDFSEDNSLQIASSFEDKISLIDLSKRLDESFRSKANKKKGISLAVSEAKFDLILCSDADCVFGPNWISSMQQNQAKYGKDFLTGPLDYKPTNSFWISFLRMDLLAMMGVTAGSIGQKQPVMANGANMMFTKEIFQKINGFEDNHEIASGDDVFLMQKIFRQNPKGVGFVKSRSAIAFTLPPRSFSEFVNQRIRWTSKSRHGVSGKIQIILLFNYLFTVLCTLNIFLFSFFNIDFLLVGLAMFLFKIIVDVLFFKNVLSFFQHSWLLVWILPMEVLHILYVSVLGLLSLSNGYKWKGRKVKM